MPLHPGKVQNDWIPKAPDPSQAAAEQPRQELTCSCRSLAISSLSLCSSSSLCSASIRALSISFSLIRCSYSCHSWALHSVANWKGSTTAEESKVFSEVTVLGLALNVAASSCCFCSSFTCRTQDSQSARRLCHESQAQSAVGGLSYHLLPLPEPACSSLVDLEPEGFGLGRTTVLKSGSGWALKCGTWNQCSHTMSYMDSVEACLSLSLCSNEKGHTSTWWLSGSCGWNGTPKWGTETALADKIVPDEPSGGTHHNTIQDLLGQGVCFETVRLLPVLRLLVQLRFSISSSNPSGTVGSFAAGFLSSSGPSKIFLFSSRALLPPALHCSSQKVDGFSVGSSAGGSEAGIESSSLTASQSSFVAGLVFPAMQSNFPLQAPDAFQLQLFRAAQPVWTNPAGSHPCSYVQQSLGQGYTLQVTSTTMNTQILTPNMAAIRKKLVIVGDGACGKTCLLIVFSKDQFPEVYVPTVFENYVADIEVDGKQVELALWDTAGQEDYDRLRPLSYPDTDVILMCFSIDSPDSLENIPEKWTPEVKHFCPNVPIILVGNKKDLRNDDHTRRELAKMKQEPVKTEEGRDMSNRINASGYLECSAKTKDGVRDVFEMATRAALQAKKRGRKTAAISHKPVSGSMSECRMRKSRMTMAELGLKSSEASSSFT
ncbi:hypothetical protein CCH79_00017897 [Gambusia affinis]|uniref:Small monomeric GTPase n=2 Tax=Clupeocephala TaxID=186625 RepID=A0A315VL40_GAMAF|nr:hypothetical protein CCH79_00017897 [Gambusia affinis]